MSAIAVIIILVSCVMHAGWNLACKSQKPSATFFAAATSTAVLAMLPLYIYFAPHLAFISWSMWTMCIAVGIFQTLYYICLGNAYRLFDMSMAYPIARSLPVLMVPIVTAIIGFGKPLSWIAISGMIIVTIGCVTLPLKSLRWNEFRALLHRNFLFLLGAAIGTTGYSIVDNILLVELTSGAHSLSKIEASLFVIAASAICTLPFIWAAVFFQRAEMENLREIKRRTFTIALLAGPVIALTDILVFQAMQHANNVSYIVAFRQAGVVIGVILGLSILKESITSYKIAGTAFTVIGLVMVALG